MTRRLQLGAASTQITPPLLVSLDGEFRDRKADRVVSDLHARALVVDDGVDPIALLALDACRLDPDVRDRIFARVATVSRIAPDRVLLTCTHTHGAPTLIETPWYSPDESYLDVFVRRAGDAVALADAQRRPGRLAAFTAREGSLPFNRRYRMRDGSVRTNPGPLNPGIVEPAGGIDPALGIWQATEETGRTIAVVVNYALHAAVVTRGVSGDFPAVIERELRDVLGPDVQVLFLSGCCGDVNHTDVSVPGPRLGPTVAHDIGQRIACTVLDEIAKSPEAVVGAKDPTALRISTRHVEVAFRSPPSANGRWGDAIPAAIEGVSESVSSRTTSDTGLVEVRRYRDWWLAKSARTADVVTVRSLICGDMALVTLPGEMFVQLGLDIRLASPFRNLLLATLNGSASYYLPPADAYAEGGYEVESTPLAPGGAEEIVRVVLDDLVAFSSGASA